MIYINLDKLSPWQFLVYGYFAVIALGTFLLALPASTAVGNSTGFIEALFTSTSATAVTGLIVVNTAEHWSTFGKVVIMLLIQIGGFGFMTTTSFFFMLLGKRFSLRNKIIIQEDINYSNLSSVLDMTRYIIYLTLITELIGSVLLYFYFRNLMSTLKAVFFALFHSISAFNNAGFDLFGNSLEGFYNSTYINIVIGFLFVFGGLGFIVISEIYTKSKFTNLTLHAKMVIVLTVFLILAPSFFIFFMEYENPATIGQLNLKGKVLGAFFQGITPRTAGFNTIPIGNFRDVTLFLMIILMFIGASPGSTGGGVKTTTIGTLLVVAYNLALGKEDMEVFRARLRRKDIYKALTIVVISLALIALITILLTVTEEFQFIDILFEVFSAFGTVGLSTGITGQLSAFGRFFIILTMFIGRVGPFTIAMAIGRRKISNIRYPEEDILIG